MNRGFWRLVSLAFLLSTVTAAFLGWTGRYGVVDDAVLANLQFENELESWNGTPHDIALSVASPRTVRIQANFGGQVPLVTQIVRDLDGISHLRISADVRTEDIVPGWEFWQRAGVFLYSVSHQNRRIWYWPFEVALIEGTSEWRRHTAIIPVSADAGYMQLFLFNASRSGSMYVRNLTVESVTEPALARALWWGLVGAWAILAAVVLAVLVRHRRGILALVTCGGAVAIILSLLWPQPDLSILQRTALRTALVAAHTAVDALRSEPVQVAEHAASEEPDAVGEAGPDAGDEPGPDSDSDTGPDADAGSDTDSEQSGEASGDGEAGATMNGGRPDGPVFDLFNLDATAAAHLLVFVVLAVFARLAFRRDDATYLLIALTAFAQASEVIQGFTITRTVELEDGIYNAFGAILGLLAASAALALASGIRARLLGKGR